MATISTRDDSKVYTIKKFLGLNESEDGDTQLKMGEASVLDNFEITSEYHLRVRPGYNVLHSFNGPVRGMWHGYVAGGEVTVCAADGAVWNITENGAENIGDILDAPTTFFGFGDKLYMLNGIEYLVWDGIGYVDSVGGYVPVIVTASAPGGGGTTLEPVNMLTGKRRVKFSADGESTVYHLPETNVTSIDFVFVEGAEQTAGFTVDKAAGTVTFSSAPAQGSNNVQVFYNVANTLRDKIEKMRFSEFFNGSSDTRVFLYGDGSNKAYYCGVTEDGEASAEYFPDLYEVQIGTVNTPITAMARHYSKLLVFKPEAVYATSYSAITLEDGSTTAGFYTVPIHRAIGNEAPGQVQLVNNYPSSFCAGNIYEWRLATTLYADERNAKNISDRVQRSMNNADVSKIHTFDNDMTHEYFVFLGDEAGTVLVNNYEIGVWYMYTGLPAACACCDGTTMYLGFSDGRVVDFDHIYTTDDGEVINSRYESGNMAFDADFKRKTSSIIWVSMKPAVNARILISARSDKKSDYAEKEVVSNLSGFDHVNFWHFSFLTNRAPQMERVKLKVKKFVYYKLVITSGSSHGDVTVLGIDQKVRYTGNVK